MFKSLILNDTFGFYPSINNQTDENTKAEFYFLIEPKKPGHTLTLGLIGSYTSFNTGFCFSTVRLVA